MSAAIVQGLHMVAAIFWFGGTMFTDFVLGPAVARAQPASQADVGAQIGLQAARVIPPVAGLAILLGFLRGTVFGPLKSASDVLNLNYGHWWLIALVLAIATFVFGQRVTGRASARIALVPEAERPAQIQRTIRLASFELVGFFGIFAMMILMRFYP